MAAILVIGSLSIAFILWQLVSLLQNYITARKIGLPILIGPIDMVSLNHPFLVKSLPNVESLQNQLVFLRISERQLLQYTITSHCHTRRETMRSSNIKISRVERSDC